MEPKREKGETIFELFRFNTEQLCKKSARVLLQKQRGSRNPLTLLVEQSLEVIHPPALALALHQPHWMFGLVSRSNFLVFWWFFILAFVCDQNVSWPRSAALQCTGGLVPLIITPFGFLIILYSWVLIPVVLQGATKIQILGGLVQPLWRFGRQLV